MSNLFGDSHNFGRRVSVHDQWVSKPRTTFWERMFLSDESSLRAMINSTFVSNGCSSPFEISPSLNFSKSGHENLVERVILDTEKGLEFPWEEKMSAIGSMISLSLWAGLSDLHCENMMIGYFRGQYICFPVDIEVVFDHLTHVNQTLLSPRDVNTVDKSGLRDLWRVVSHLSTDSRVDLLTGFASATNLLNKISSRDIIGCAGREIFDHEIRVIPRNTSTYRQALDTRVFSGFLSSEVAQMERGDIPYFFRRLGSPDIFHLDSKGFPIKSGFAHEEFAIAAPLIFKLDASTRSPRTLASLWSLKTLASLLGFKVSSIISNQFQLTTKGVQLVGELNNGFLKVS